jgi:hypothetical protein
MKAIAKHLVKSIFILAIVTVVSLGIRQVRFSVHRARTVESPVIAEVEPDPLPAEPETVDTEPKPQYVEAPEPDEEVIPEDYSETKPSKSDYAKAKGSKGLEKISLGDNEDLYVTGEGELWYVSKQPDGSVVKMQVHIDQTNGEMNVVDIASGKSQGSQSLEKISMSDYEDLYITGEGDLWYVSRQPDGSTTKNQALIDEATGEMVIIDSGDGDK